ncbi:MFS transporter [Spongiactinospora sp. TRM90649]|uniref:MFS transporter n=1 Tax=Spongiactinospora sp. TRM90649 TaxID=3031114 RepID=UPI0023F7C71E|nr:MFS transporter [Spongiactinospora sp. TRM90649]MDF5756998.1 MFS transporter [Spongiactinospora sp. TRM90649]
MTDRGHERRRWAALGVGLMASFMSLLDVSIVNVALPSIRAGLHAPESALQWIVSGYALAFGLLLVPGGRLGDARSRRTMFMTGLALFITASAAAGLAQNVWWLVGARFVQGAASGLMNPQISGLIQQLFRGAERGRAFGALGTTIGIATAAGPVLGGLIIGVAGAEEGWRWVFYVNVPVGLAALVLARTLFPAGEIKKCESLDPLGVVLLGIGMVSLLLPFAQARQWAGSGKWLLLAVSAVFLIAFVLWERHYARHGTPLVNLSLFRKRSYALGAGLIMLYFAGFTAIFFTFTLYLQSGLGFSPLAAGLAITPFALGSGTASMIGGRIVARYGRTLVAAGLCLVLAGLLGVLVAVQFASGPDVAYAMLLPLLVGGIGSGLVVSPNATITLSEVPPAGGGSAAGMLQTGQRIGAAFGVAAVGSLFFATVAQTGGDWASAFEHALLMLCVFVLAALSLAGVDLVKGRREARAGG